MDVIEKSCSLNLNLDKDRLYGYLHNIINENPQNEQDRDVSDLISPAPLDFKNEVKPGMIKV